MSRRVVHQVLVDGIYIYFILFHVQFGRITTDETSFSSLPCNKNQFPCNKDVKCIDYKYKCDYHQDCSDGVDEEYCGSCTFEEGMCGYENRHKQDVFKRMQPDKRLLNVPPIDHTTNSSKGHFVITGDVLGGTENWATSSILESGVLSPTSPHCVVVFNYYYASSQVSVLRVKATQQYAIQYDYEYIISLLWKEELKSMNKWQQVIISVGQRPYGWTLVLSADHNDIAIDDIRFENCSYPRPNETCTSDQVRCDDGACRYATQSCDYSKDCLDGSDESNNNCEDYFLLGCDFEYYGYCDWSQSETDDFDWSFGGDNTKIHTPPVDHTTGTPMGSFLVIDTPKYSGNEISQIVSVDFIGGIRDCYMRFFYYMDPGYHHSLSIKLQIRNNSISLQKFVSSVSQVEGYLWNHALVNLKSDEHFKVVMEAKIGELNKGVIAIDDISFSPKCKVSGGPEPCRSDEFNCGDEQCIPCVKKFCICNFVAECKNKADEEGCQPSCDFKNEDTCGWNNEDGNDVNWKVWSGHTPSNGTGPINDHTTKNKTGYYLYVDAKQDGERNVPKGYFISPVYKHGSYDCKFSFWYNMFHAKVIGHCDAILAVKFRIRPFGKEIDTTLWTDWFTTGMGWKQVVMQLPRCPQDFNIIFEADHYWNTRTDVAIDDWKFHCSEKPPTPCNSTTEFQCAITKQCISLDTLCDIDLNCCDGSDENDKLCSNYSRMNFNNGFEKGWTQLKNDDFDFTINNGVTDSSGTGPIFDHISYHGSYVYTKPSLTHKENETAAIGSPIIDATNGETCTARFWYNMYGMDLAMDIGTLSVYTAIVFGIPHNKVWSLSGDQGRAWKKAEVTLISDKVFQVIFEVSIGSNSYNALAIDDISFTPGCVFNESILPGMPTLPPTTTTNPCAPNFYCLLNATCISQENVCDFSKNCGDGSDESVALCGYPQGFEHGFGTWRSLHNYSLHNFTLHKGQASEYHNGPSTDGPSTDAKGNATGHYIYLTSKSKAGEKAAVESPWYKVAYANCNLTLSYYIYGNYIGQLKAYLITNDTEPTDLLDLRGNMGSNWSVINVPIGRRREPFKIQLDGLLDNGNKGGIALDEINFSTCSHPPMDNKGCRGDDMFRCKNDVCIPTSKTCDFVDDCGDLSDEDHTTVCSNYTWCNFDDDSCNFTQDNATDEFDWTLNHGQTNTFNTGPTHDHTYRTYTGNYLYIEVSRRIEGHKARIQTFPLKVHPKSICILKFYYHMFGDSLGVLNINILTGENRTRTRTLRKKFNDTSMFMWRKAELDLSNEIGTFWVEFEGVVGSSYHGDIAIDDIIFTPNCSATNDKPNCSADGHTCDCHHDNSCPNVAPDEHKYDTLIIIVLCTLLIISLFVLVIVIIVARRKRVEKFHIYSMFNEPTFGREMVPQVSTSTIDETSIGSENNLGYDTSEEQYMNEDKRHAASCITLSPPPVYQEVFHVR